MYLIFFNISIIAQILYSNKLELIAEGHSNYKVKSINNKKIIRSSRLEMYCNKASKFLNIKIKLSCNFTKKFQGI